jgi:hypothetical protein
MRSLTPEMFRVLRVLADCPGAWISLETIGDWAPMAGLLREDDVVAVPGLIERGLAGYDAGMEAVRITTAGRLAALEGIA